MEILKLKQEFTSIFGNEGELKAFFAPGRVNLIGEHTDYNGGFVFPCALNFGIYAVARKRNDNLMRFASLNFDLKVDTSIDNIKYNKANGWANYPIGVVNEFIKQGFKTTGFDILIKGDIPNGAGLSSSAALEILTSIVLRDLNRWDIEMTDMAKLCQKSENEFIGVNCGIMDQFAVGMGKKNHAIFLNCQKLEYEYVPLAIKGHKIVITNTNKRRGLADSKYNERREQCENAVKILSKNLNLKFLGDINAKQFEDNKTLITDPTILKRAEHIIYENDRVLKSVEMLKFGDIVGFGQMMNQSHISLRDLYEVSCKELDIIVEQAQQSDGVLGSRMTGAGFGGCTVSIVRDEYVDKFIKDISEIYTQKTGLTADFYIAEIGGGAMKI